MRSDAENLVNKYKFKSKIDLKTSNQDIVFVQSNPKEASDFGIIKPRIGAQERNISILPLNILQQAENGSQNPEVSKYIDNSITTNITSNMANYNLNAEIRSSEEIKKKYFINNLVEKYFVHNEFFNQIQRLINEQGDLGSNPSERTNNLRLEAKASERFERARQSVRSNEAKAELAVLVTNYQSLERKLTKLPKAADVKKVLKSVQGAEALGVLLEKLAKEGQASETWKQVVSQHRRERSVSWGFKKLVGQESGVSRQLDRILEMKKPGVKGVSKSLAVVDLWSLDGNIKAEKQLAGAANEFQPGFRQRAKMSVHKGFAIGIAQELKERFKQTWENNVAAGSKAQMKLREQTKGLVDMTALLQTRKKERINRELRQERKRHLAKTNLNVLKTSFEEEHRNNITHEIEERINRELTRIRFKSDKSEANWAKQAEILGHGRGYKREEISKLVTLLGVAGDKGLPNRKLSVTHKDIVRERQEFLVEVERRDVEVSETRVVQKERLGVMKHGKVERQDLIRLGYKNDDTLEKVKTVIDVAKEKAPKSATQVYDRKEAAESYERGRESERKSLVPRARAEDNNKMIKEAVAQSVGDSISDIANRVYDEIDSRLKVERYRMGIL